MKYLDALRTGLANILADDPRALLLGEDILDPYGGAFKVTRGLGTRFPDQVLQTPISEAGFVGVAAGLSYLSYRPIVEIMFGDFITLIADAVLNGAAKFNWLRNDSARGSLLIRTPVGGRRGYGPIHSQSLEKLYFGWPDVAVLAPNLANDPGRLLAAAFADPAAVKLFIENKSDYSAELWDEDELAARGVSLEVSGSPFPAALLSTVEPGADPDLVICGYGGMASHILDAMTELLIEDEITAVACLPTRICPLDSSAIAHWAGRAGRVLCVEEGYAAAGWGSYLLSQLAQSGPGDLRLEATRCIGSAATPIPANPDAERRHLPGAPHIVDAARALCRSTAAA